MKRPSAPIVLLCAAALFLPLWGGQIVTDRQALAPGTLLAALFGGSEVPLLTHCLFAALIAIAAGIALWKRQIIQVPGAWISLSLVGLSASVLASVTYSSFRSVSIPAAAEWLVFAMAAFATTMCLGRREGPRLFLRCLVVGCMIVALMAIMEFNRERGGDPGYRVFGGWINPNALAGVLTVGILCVLGLATSGERTETSLGGIAVAVQVLALWLTGSRAGFLAAAAGILVFFVLAISWRANLAKTGKGLAALVAGGALVALLIFSNRAHAAGDPSAPSGIGRAVAGVGAGDQSAEFRKLLYRGAIELAKERPLGYGMGTYRYYSAKPGLTTQTQFTHDTYLQLLVEAGPVALLAFLAAIGAWLVTMFRGARSLPPEQNALRAGVVAAVIATLGQGVFESNLYYFGMGVIFFCLLGVGVLIAGDGVAPEYMAKNFRLAGVGAASTLVLVLGWFGVGEMKRAEARFALQQRDREGAQAAAQSAAGLIPGDADALGILARLAEMPEALTLAKKAADAGPSTTALRRLSEMQAQIRDVQGAEGTLSKALDLDPNNLTTRHQLLDLQIDSNNPAAKDTAAQMIAVEDSPYFKVRSLPELIPTETLDARLYLASLETDAPKKTALLRAVVEGFVKYAQITVPPVARMASQGLPYGEETLEKAKQKIAKAQEAAKQLKELYGAGDASGGAFVDDALKALDGAADFLNK